VNEYGNRQSVFLKRSYTEQSANDLKRVIETLIDCRNNNQVPNKRVFTYLETSPPEIRAKLEKVGLITQSKIRTCGELWDAFEADDRGIKESTKKNYRTIRKRFFTFYKESDPVEKLTKESLLNWKKYLAKHRYAPASISNAIAKVKCVLNWATNEKDIFVKSPGIGIKKGSCVNKARSVFVTMSDYETIFSACRTQEQRTILVLARIGGLRIPSEISRLTWSDILWDIGKIWVSSPKTEHHPGKEGRFIPLWEPIRKELEALFFADEPDGKNDRVFRDRNSSSNLRTRFCKIQIRAGIVPMDKFFTNCRASRSTEVFEKYGAFLESQWIGHTQAVASSILYDNGSIVDTDSNYSFLCESPVSVGIQRTDGTFEIYSEGEIKLIISDIVVGSLSCQCTNAIRVTFGTTERIYRNYQLASYTSSDIVRCNAYYTITQDGAIHYGNEVVGEITYDVPDYTNLCEKYLWDHTTEGTQRRTPYNLYYSGELVYEDSMLAEDSWYANCCNNYFVLVKNYQYATSTSWQARFFFRGELYLDDIVSHLTCCPGPNADRFISKNTSVLYVHDEEYGFMKFDPRSLSRIA